MAKLFQKTCKMTNIDKQTEDNFQERIIEMAKALSEDRKSTRLNSSHSH